MVIILLQCIAGYGGGLPQKLHLTLVSPLAVVVVNTSTPVGGDVSIVIMAIIDMSLFVITNVFLLAVVNGHCITIFITICIAAWVISDVRDD